MLIIAIMIRLVRGGLETRAGVMIHTFLADSFYLLEGTPLFDGDVWHGSSS